tara:strand:- start:3207 stop:3722 length:516 start_codon:yes stop_codon:yes gene_type:complete
MQEVFNILHSLGLRKGREHRSDQLVGRLPKSSVIAALSGSQTKAPGFAGGCLLDKMVRQAGWIAYTARQFVTLCERAGADYPADVFSDQILAEIEDGSLQSGWKGTVIPASIAGLVQTHADRLHPLPIELAQKLLYILDALVDLGDPRSAALQSSESFRGVRLTEPRPASW